MLIIIIVIYAVLLTSIFILPRVKSKTQLIIVALIQLVFMTSIFTMGEVFISILENKITTINQLRTAALILGGIVGVYNKKYYKKFSVKN